LADEDYGISLIKVREIIGMMPVTSVPRTPNFVMGVINLRGKVIPITDLRLKFALPEMDYSDRTCIIVVDV
jgi:purine-binding chemotaxis protein CheW